MNGLMNENDDELMNGLMNEDDDEDDEQERRAVLQREITASDNLINKLQRDIVS